MLNKSLTGPILLIYQFKNATKNINTAKYLHSCVCGKIYLHNHALSTREWLRIQSSKGYRAHSTQSDQHRQKVVIESVTPKIVIDKLEEKVLPHEKILQEGGLKHKIVLWKGHVDPYVKLMRLDKPIGIWLLFWPCSWSIALGAVHAGAPLALVCDNLLLFLAGSVVMRGAGCTINDLFDRDIDAQVERTKHRPLVSGQVSPRRAVVFLAAQLSLALAILLQLNWASVALGASSMALVVTYPLAKRWSAYPQLYLGLTFNWGALLGFVAVTGTLAAQPAALYAGAVAWTLLYDTVYAHQDKIDDARIGIKSTALTFGDNAKPPLTAVAALSTALLGSAGHLAGLDWPFYAALAAAAGHAGHQIYTLDPNSPDDCAKKFKSNTWIGLLIFLGIVGGGYSQYNEKRKANTSDNVNGVDSKVN